MAEKSYGYVGKILRVNLTTGEKSVFSSEKYQDMYLGGKGMAARLYWEEVAPEVKPFDPENKLFFTSGPLNGTGAMQAAKGCLGGKSPVWYPVNTFTFGTTANFAPMMKRAGFDAIIIEGKADHPVYLWIYNGHCEIRDAWDLWGKTTRNARELLYRKHNKKVVSATIGPAGENLVVSACVSVAANQVFGRGGFGAVMGSKNLKSVVVYGDTPIYVAQPMKLLEINRERAKFNSIKVGEKRIVDGKEIVGKPFEETAACNFGSVGAETQLREMARRGEVQIKPNGCEGCAVFCRTKFHFKDGSQPDTSVICSSNIGWSIPEAIHNKWQKKMLGCDSYNFAQTLDDMGLNMNDFCVLAPLYGCRGQFDENEHIEGTLLGGDWIYQAHLFGILTNENTGLPWELFGTKEFNDKFLEMIVYRRGFGDILARGFRYATQYIYEHEEFGPNREKILFIYQRINAKAGNMGCLEHGHGQYVPNPGRTVYAAVGDRTGSEPEFQWGKMSKYPSDTPEAVREKWLGEGANKILDPWYWGPEVAHAVVRHEDYCNVVDSLHICAVGNMLGGVSLAAYTNRAIAKTRDYEDWLYHSPHGGSEFLEAVTGKPISLAELDAIGSRITNLIRAIWVRDGYTTQEDSFWGNEVDALWPMQYARKDPEGRVYNPKEGFQATIADYYAERGWVEGVPTRQTLEQYGLKDVADELESKGLLKG